MEASVFDPSVFLDAQQSEVNEKRDSIPVENPDSSDGCYTAIIGEVTTKSGTIGKGDRMGQPWASMVVPLKLQLGPQVQARGLPAEFQITDMVFLDLTASGAIDNSKGKNNAQRAYRIALGMNEPGVPFSWRATQGRPVKVKIKHEMYLDTIQERIAVVLPA